MEAYAKLVDRNSLENEADTEKREFLITELPCSLGRTPMQSSEHYSIVIDSTDVLLSRQHAQIKWSQDDGWTLTCLSKNGLFVDERKYRKNDSANLHDGSNIRLGNSKLIFVLPPRIPDSIPAAESSSSNKRARTDSLLDGEPDHKKSEIDGTTSGISTNIDNILPPEQDVSHSKISYKDMIDAAFDSYELDLDEDQSVLQTELVDWIASKYYNLQEDNETRKQSLRKGLYSILMKHFERVGSDENKKRQKRGTIRWRPRQDS